MPGSSAAAAGGAGDAQLSICNQSLPPLKGEGTEAAGGRRNAWQPGQQCLHGKRGSRDASTGVGRPHSMECCWPAGMDRLPGLDEAEPPARP